MTGLDRTTWPEADRLAGQATVVLIPLGSTEQHGPHLPLTTDTDIAVAVTVAASARYGHALVAPALSYGSSGEHQAFAGTLSLGQEATESMLVELGRSAAVHFARTVVVSAHGGNAAPLRRAMERLAAEHRPVEAWSPLWGGDLHAGRTETSIMLAIAPERVDLGRARAGDRRDLATLLPILRREGVRSVSENGVLGDPTGASAEEGRALLAEAVDDLVAALERPVARRPVEAGR
jgi:creatinine amidohydrolase